MILEWNGVELEDPKGIAAPVPFTSGDAVPKGRRLHFHYDIMAEATDPLGEGRIELRFDGPMSLASGWNDGVRFYIYDPAKPPTLSTLAGHLALPIGVRFPKWGTSYQEPLALPDAWRDTRTFMYQLKARHHDEVFAASERFLFIGGAGLV